jgi:hypothetical protein
MQEVEQCWQGGEGRSHLDCMCRVQADGTEGTNSFLSSNQPFSSLNEMIICKI